MVLIYDTYIGCQENTHCAWTRADEGKIGLLGMLKKLLTR